ncbi:Uncharacterized protein APZ42_018870 [Daphnia magna]|uniref:Uncharacterized protein n=1 Tax=Daphnia magna TaxID=35525 RepID=A0A164YVA8_9CRUS|nr:Uncharacterized protein APZ42_018870 [Daphnia magna]
MFRIVRKVCRKKCDNDVIVKDPAVGWVFWLCWNDDGSPPVVGTWCVCGSAT